MSPGERMTDVFDRASTLNFTTVATVRGVFSEAQLRGALGCLMRRHPLLTARIERGSDSWSLNPGEAAAIPLSVADGDLDSVGSRVSESLNHRCWEDSGPRGELTWIRHAADHSSLLLCLHHTVSDGSSGILAMRDLLAFLEQPSDAAIEELAAPGQDHYFPPLFAELRDRFLASVAGAPPPAQARPFRLRTNGTAPIEQRRTYTTAIRLDREDSDRVTNYARRIGATVHGVLCASVSAAIARESDLAAPQLHRFAHPVTLRRYLAERFPAQPVIGDAVGYYVSSVHTDHEVHPRREFDQLAREFSEAVRAKLDAHEPLLTAPIRGPMLAQRAEKLGMDAFRTWVEADVFTGTFALSNLGALERLGARTQVGSLTVEDLYFAIAPSILGPFSGAAVSFDGRITLQLTHVEPLLQQEVVQRIADRVRHQLTDGLL